MNIFFLVFFAFIGNKWYNIPALSYRFSYGQRDSERNAEMKKPLFKRPWFIAIVIIVIIVIIGSFGGNSDEPAEKVTPPAKTETTITAPEKESTPVKEAEPNVPEEYQSALKKAQSYSDRMYMSKAGIYDQLISEYGEQFTEEAAQYAMENVKADWKANALAKAHTYQEKMDMSPAAIYDQLISEYGEKFTEEEAQYAVDNL